VADSDDTVAAIVTAMEVAAAWPPHILENVSTLVLAVGSSIASTRTTALHAADASRVMQSALESLLFQAPLDVLSALRDALAPFAAADATTDTPAGVAALALDALVELATVAADVPEALQVRF
jgi:hypothetical protein